MIDIEIANDLYLEISQLTQEYKNKFLDTNTIDHLTHDILNHLKHNHLKYNIQKYFVNTDLIHVNSQLTLEISLDVHFNESFQQTHIIHLEATLGAVLDEN